MTTPAAGKYIKAQDLITRLTPETYLQIFDDENTGDVANVNDVAVQQVIDGAEGEVDSYLIVERALPLPSPPALDRIVVATSLDFAEALSFLRHPEYARTFGENPRAQALWERGSRRMERVKEGRQNLPDTDQQNPKPLNTGGLVLDEGPRTIVTGSDGTENGFGF